MSNMRSELQEAQQKKIDYFCEFTNNNNLSQAEYYLNKANWDEKMAVEFYFNKPDYRYNNNNIYNIPNEHNLKRHASAKMRNNNENDIINNSKNLNYKYGHIVYDQNSKYIEYNINDLLKEKENKGSHYTHDKTYLYVKNNLKNPITNFKSFMEKLEYNAGVILIFREENIYKLKEQIPQVNEIREKIQNIAIIPVNYNSDEGLSLITGLFCVSFPSYIFCKYKNRNTIYITDKMEGAFDKKFLFDCLYKIKPDIIPVPNKENNNKPNMKVLPRPQTNVNKKNKEIFDNLFDQFHSIGNELNRKKKEIDKNKYQRDNKIQNKIPNNFQNKYDNNKDSKKNDKYDKYKNNNDIYREGNKFQNNYNNKNINNINYLNNNNIINKNDNNNKNENNKFKFSDGDFFLGNSIEIPALFGYYNNNIGNIGDKNSNNINNPIEKNIQNNNININESKNIIEDNKDKNIPNNNSINPNINQQNNMDLRDSIYNLSYGQIFAKREEEMRKLEKMQQEKEKKEEEEKKKQLEEEKKIKNYEKESEIAKMILAPEPDESNPDVCHIKFRLPDGEKIKERRFLKTDKISVLYDYIKSIGREIFMEHDSTDFDILYVGFPPKNLENSKNNTLESEGLYPNSILQISEK